MRFAVSVVLVSLALATACGGAPRPRLSELRSTYTDDTGTSSYRLAFDYVKDSHIDTITAYDPAGVAEFTLTMTYTGDLIEEIVGTEVGSSDTETYALEYDDDDRLSRVDVTYVGADGTDTANVELDYDEDGRVVQVTYSATDPTGTEQEITEYEYDGDLLTRMQEVGAGYSTTLDYDDDDQLDQVDLSGDGGVFTTRFTYGDGRVSRLTWGDSGRTEVEYNSDDYISEVTTTYSTQVNKVEYTYEDGEMDGMVPTPAFLYGNLFHMEGQMMRPLEMATLYMLAF